MLEGHSEYREHLQEFWVFTLDLILCAVFMTLYPSFQSTEDEEAT